MAQVIIFGIRDLAELAYHYLSSDSPHEVIAFTVNRTFMPDIKQFCNLPIIPFEDIEFKYNRNDVKFFAPMTHTNLNRDRQNVFNEIKRKNFEFISYISSSAIIPKNALIGDNCFILERVVIQPFVNIGDNNIIWSGCTICHHSAIENNVFIAPSVSISGHCIIKSNSFLGIGCVIRDGLIIEEGCIITLGSHIINNTESYSLYKGNPAKKIKQLV